jgi:arginyl-tRNA synthetase|tara:strand:- start:2623 stop:4290 length:1668 start_codon:yes stop_codon:yes gene_type:complete
MIKKEIIDIIKKITNLKEKEINRLLAIPPDKKFGDYSIHCYTLAKLINKDPNDLAKDIAFRIKSPIVEKTQIMGPYLNIFINKQRITQTVLEEVLKKKQNFGSQKQKKKIIIEYCAPNTNKPLHLGHLRNIALGESTARILEFLGNKVTRLNLVNDRGIHIMQSMLAYQKFGKKKKPNKKSDHFVGDFYVMFSKKANGALNKEAQELLIKWESNDKSTLSLWNQMNKWALSGFDQTYKRLGIKFNKTYYESDYFDKGKDIVSKGLKEKIFNKDKEENIIADLSEYNIPNRILLRKDKTSVYITQDLALAELKFKDYHPDLSIYVVATEQNLHFKQLFAILEKLKSKASSKCYHLSYGLVLLPEGKMKSREGNIVDADNILDEVVNLAGDELKSRKRKITKQKKSQIGMGALKFYLLKIDTTKDIVYDPKESISFTGDTAPYVQYAHARICSILKKTKTPKKVDFSLLYLPQETELSMMLSKFPSIVKEAANNYKPSLITNYLLDLTKSFNRFYDAINVLNAEPKLKDSRLSLILAVKQVLSNGLSLLGIDAPKEM